MENLEAQFAALCVAPVGVLLVAVAVFGFLCWVCFEADQDRDRDVQYNIRLESYVYNRRSKLDLHGYSKHDSVNELRRFLEDCYQVYKRGIGNCYVDVITGRGLHSIFGFSVLKQMVERYLENNYRNYKWAWHEGKVTVNVASKY